MTFKQAKAHIEYMKITKPEICNDIGITENIDDNIIEAAAEIATQTHWGAPEISVEMLFDKALKKLIVSNYDTTRG